METPVSFSPGFAAPRVRRGIRAQERNAEGGVPPLQTRGPERVERYLITAGRVQGEASRLGKDS